MPSLICGAQAMYRGVGRSVLLACGVSWTLGPGVANAGEGGSSPDFRLLRYEEDHRLRGPASRSRLAELKHVRLSERDDIYLSFGGDLRLRYEAYRSSDRVDGAGEPATVEDFVLLRGIAHADLHLTRFSRTFVQLSTLRSLGQDVVPSPLDVNALAFQQGFTELRFGLGAGDLTIRGGRQEVVLGSGRLVAVRKGPNFRRSFDMLRLRWAASGRGSVDLLGGTTVRPAPGPLDDVSNRADLLWGLYGTLVLPAERAVGVDGYYLGVRRTDQVYQDASGLENRHSLGARVYGKPADFDYNFEGLIQVGTLETSSILAWTLASDSGYTIKGERARLRAGVRADVTSGDTRSGDGRLGTFNALYPNLKYFSEAGLLVPSNHLDVHPALGLRWERVQVSADWGLFWRYALADAIYAPPGRIAYAAESSRERFVGQQLTAELGASLSVNARITLYYTRFFRGPAVAKAGGQNVDFLGTWIEHTF